MSSRGFLMWFMIQGERLRVRYMQDWTAEEPRMAVRTVMMN